MMPSGPLSDYNAVSDVVGGGGGDETIIPVYPTVRTASLVRRTRTCCRPRPALLFACVACLIDRCLCIQFI